jgi:predicted short-subunit dehydrogenase-like oxidoreductase (DUF2520 family)
MRPKIAIVGAGNVGQTLALALRGAGYRIREIVSRSSPASRRRARALARRVGARAVILGAFKPHAGVIWLCVPDREIHPCALSLASRGGDWHGLTVVHPSGSLLSDELQPLAQLGADIASAHPLMTFVRRSQPSLEGVGFTVEGDRAAVQVVREIVVRLGAKLFPINKKQKAAYHAWATVTSPMMTALLATAEEVAKLAGVPRAQARRRMMPILRETLENYSRFGPAAGFSGPIVRGDAATVEKHLRELRASPVAAHVYRRLALAALENLPVKNRNALKKVLGK